VNPPTAARSVKDRTRRVGALLRYWRATRRVSQLDLALDADISTRHLSYIETGRAQPSCEMVLRLADALQVPLRERNALLLAAGYAPLYRETGLDAAEMSEARRALEFILVHHEPYPAIILDRYWNFLMTNSATDRFITLFLQSDPPGRRNGLRLLFHPEGLRPFVEHWEKLAARLIQRVHREVASNPSDLVMKALLDELLGYPDVPSRWRTPDLDRWPTPFLTLSYRHNGRMLRFFSTIATFGTPQDVTLQELRIECFFPADDVTRSAITSEVMDFPIPTGSSLA
jgi:transcriptional regulator with XRE-family HTH domain